MSNSERKPYRFPILTPKQFADLDVGPTRVVQIKAKEAYEQTRIIRGPQAIKNMAVQDFVEGLLGKFERDPPTAEDARNIGKMDALIGANLEAHGRN